MKTHITIKREGKAWAWFVKRGNKVISGRTKRDARNDAMIAKAFPPTR